MGHRLDDGCRTTGCSVTKQTIEDDLKKGSEFKSTTNRNRCKAGDENYCPTVQTHPWEVIGFTATALIGGPLIQQFALGGGLASLIGSSFFLPTLGNGLVGGAFSSGAYIALSILNGRDVTTGGLAGSLTAGFVAGVASMGATPLAGSVLHQFGLSASGVNLAVGSAMVNGAGGVLAYHSGGIVNNVIDVSNGKRPSFTPTQAGNGLSFAIPAVVSPIAGSYYPVKGVSTLSQASSFIPGRTWNTVFQNNNLYQQTIYSSIAGGLYVDALGGGQ